MQHLSNSDLHIFAMKYKHGRDGELSYSLQHQGICFALNQFLGINDVLIQSNLPKRPRVLSDFSL